MPVSVVLPNALLPYAEGSGTLQLSERCPTVSHAFAEVARRWPAVSDRILTEQGAVRRHVNVFVGDESIRFLSGLASPLLPDDVITIVPAVSGG